MRGVQLRITTPEAPSQPRRYTPQLLRMRKRETSYTAVEGGQTGLTGRSSVKSKAAALLDDDSER